MAIASKYPHRATRGTDARYDHKIASRFLSVLSLYILVKVLVICIII